MRGSRERAFAEAGREIAAREWWASRGRASDASAAAAGTRPGHPVRWMGGKRALRVAGSEETRFAIAGISITGKAGNPSPLVLPGEGAYAMIPTSMRQPNSEIRRSVTKQPPLAETIRCSQVP